MFLTYLQKAAVQGAVAAAYSYAAWGPANVQMSNPFFTGPEVSLSLILSVLAAGASVAADLIHDQIDPSIDHRKKIQDSGAITIGALASAAVFAGGLQCYNDRLLGEFGYTRAVLLGALAELTSVVVLDNLHEMRWID